MAAGLEPEQAVRANHALGNLVAGAALWEAAGLGGSTGESRSEAAATAGSVAERLATDGPGNMA